MKQPKTWESFIQVRDGQLMKFDYPAEGFDQPSWRRPPKRKGYTGEMTAGARKRVMTAVDILLQLSPNRRIFNPIIGKEHDFRVGFATLTVTDDVAPKIEEGNEALGIWLRHFKKPWSKRKMSEPMTDYVWKAELQKRGTLHYHITTANFLHLVEVNVVWNDIQRKMGWLENWKAKTGNYSPPSTDIHAVWQVKNLPGYISKYMGKTDWIDVSHLGLQQTKVPVQLDGKIWGCSENLRGKKRYSAKMDMETWENLAWSVEGGAVEKKEFERCDFYNGASLNQLSPKLHSDYMLWKQ